MDLLQVIYKNILNMVHVSLFALNSHLPLWRKYSPFVFSLVVTEGKSTPALSVVGRGLQIFALLGLAEGMQTKGTGRHTWKRDKGKASLPAGEKGDFKGFIYLERRQGVPWQLEGQWDCCRSAPEGTDDTLRPSPTPRCLAGSAHFPPDPGRDSPICWAPAECYTLDWAR